MTLALITIGLVYLYGAGSFAMHLSEIGASQTRSAAFGIFWPAVFMYALLVRLVRG